MVNVKFNWSPEILRIVEELRTQLIREGMAFGALYVASYKHNATMLMLADTMPVKP